MRQLRVLGPPAVLADGEPLSGTPAQRKALAIFGLLAAAADRGLSRDKILAYLWPETPADRAGHSLTQLLYSLRRDLHADDLFVGVSDLRLNPAVLPSDLDEFREALTRGDLDRAVAAYGGPFLDGFFLSEAPEFERWQETERAALAGSFTRALEALATAAERRGHHAKAVEAWRRLVEMDPLAAGPVARCMEALAETGDLGGALRIGQLHAARMCEELGRSADPAVSSLLERLRESPARPLPRAVAAGSVAVLPFVNLSSDLEDE